MEEASTQPCNFIDLTVTLSLSHLRIAMHRENSFHYIRLLIKATWICIVFPLCYFSSEDLSI